jgi:DNA-binding LytR/AlgR family response regulator
MLVAPKRHWYVGAGLCFNQVPSYAWEVNVLIADDDPLIGLTLRHFLEKVDPGASCTHVTDGAAALRRLGEGCFDLLFLDLELPEVDGRNVLKALPPAVPVIVVSAHTDFAARSYEFDVVDYLVKPLEFSRFQRAWQKLLARRSERGSAAARTIVVRDGNKLVQISLDRLLYLEAEANYTRLVCADRSLLTLVSLKHFAETLPCDFLRVHRSFIVNTRFIHQIEGARIKIGEHKVPVGETYRDGLLKRFAPVN